MQDALDYFADKAHHIMGFRMLTLILGFNPINRRSVPRTAANFLRALIELVPGGHVITQALDNHGVISEAAQWVEQKVAQLGDIGGAAVEAVLGDLLRRGWVRTGSVIVVERPVSAPALNWPAGTTAWPARRYGDTRIEAAEVDPGC